MKVLIDGTKRNRNWLRILHPQPKPVPPRKEEKKTETSENGR